MFTSSLLSLKSFGTWFTLKLGLNDKLKNSKNSSKFTKNHFIKRYVFYTLTYYSAQSNDIIMIDISFDSALSLEENEGSMIKIG